MDSSIRIISVCEKGCCVFEFRPKADGKNKNAASQNSDIFHFNQSACSLKVLYGWETNQRMVKVELKSRPPLSEEFYVTVDLFKGKREISYPPTHIRDPQKCTLSFPCADIEEQFPNAERWSFGFRFILRKELDCVCRNLAQTSHIPTSQCLKETDSLEKFSEDFEKLLNTGVYHDVQLKCDNVTVKANKCVLATRSSWFENKLQSTPGNVIEINFTNPDVFVEILKYIYTGKFPEWNFEKAKELYAAGDLCDTGCLKQKCIEILVDNLREDNACECLAVANDDVFREKVIQYIMDKEIYRIDEYWVKFCQQSPASANLVLNKVARLRVQGNK